MQGAGLVLAGNVAAATSAFLLARGVGRPLAEKVIKMETEENGKGTGMLANVQVPPSNPSPFL